MTATIVIASPLGPLALTANDGSLVSIDIGAEGRIAQGRPTDEERAVLENAAGELRRYFDGELKQFTVPVRAEGSAFQKRVWAAMNRVPYGEVATYGGIAKEIGSAPRAVGGACARNPVPIVQPCHRVLGSGGSLGGYSGSGGLDTKRWLLAHEGVATPAG